MLLLSLLLLLLLLLSLLLSSALWNQALSRLENKNLTISKSDAINLLEAISCMPETTVVSSNLTDSRVISNDDEALKIKSSGLLKMPRPGKRSQSVRWFKIAGKLSSILVSNPDELIKTRHMIDAYWAINSLGLTSRNLMFSIQGRLRDKSPREILLELTPRALRYYYIYYHSLILLMLLMLILY